MKKFLTVLLVVAVMFTFSFGSAFAALPSVETETEYAGVADAQKDALKTVKDYAKLSKYTAKGQAIITLALGEVEEDIKDATSISEVKGLVEAYKDYIDSEEVAQYLVATASVKEAGEAAMDQINDYLYLFDLLNIGEFDAMLEELEGEAALNFTKAAAAAEITIMAAAEEGVGTVEEVEAALDAYLQAINAVLEAEMEEGSGIPQDAIDYLVAEIEAEADSYTVNSEDYSAAVIKAYEAAIKAGVKAAKAVKTWDEYQDVAAKYLGEEDGPDAVNVDGNEVIIVRDMTGEFEKLSNKTKDVEVRIDAAEQVLAAIGAYKYSDIAVNEWEAAEEAREALADLIEDGACDADALGVIAAIEGLTKDSTKAEIKEAVKAAKEAYEAVARLAIAKEEAAAAIDAYDAGDREADEIEALVRQYKNVVKAAKTVKAVNEAVDAYEEAVEAIPTATEIAAEKAYKKFCKAVDEMLADHIEDLKDAAEEADEEFEITADQQIELDRRVAELKEANEETLVEEPSEDEIAALVDGLEFEKKSEAEALEYLDVEDVYSEKNTNLIENEVIDYVAAATKAKTWKAFYAAVDAAEKAIAKYATEAQEEYIEAAKEATAALKALGAPADTRAYEKAYEKAEEAMEAYFEAKAALDPEDKADKAVLDANKVDEQKWADAQYEQAYFEYVSAKEAAGEAETEVVAEFDAIADAILALDDCYDDAANEKIAKIISDAYAAIRKAETAAAKDAVAEKAIADLKAVAEKVDNEAYVEALEECKADAAAYFELYYGAEFASDAAKHIELAQDIIDMQEDFATVATQIEAVESLKITAGSSAKKGAITVKWSVEGETAYIDGYQVWKSTKKNSGFKKITAKTTKTQITNKKGLEAGTRYYYKVRAFQVIDGKYYYSDWSNKAYRVAK